MFLHTVRPWSLVFNQRPALVGQTTLFTSRFSTLHTLGNRYTATMFSKAVQEHPGPKKPLNSNTARLNTGTPSILKPTPSVQGAKRKFDMASSEQSPLGSLHS